MQKETYPPLLGPGRHVFSSDFLEELTVLRFPNSKSRRIIFDAFKNLLNEIKRRQLTCEMWIDGSYLTEKIEPNDIDLSIIINFNTLSSKDNDNYDFIMKHLNSGRKFHPLLDTYVAIEFNQDDPRSKTSNLSYWAELWGVDREKFLKGFAVIKIGESDVWHRIFT